MSRGQKQGTVLELTLFEQVVCHREPFMEKGVENQKWEKGEQEVNPWPRQGIMVTYMRAVTVRKRRRI